MSSITITSHLFEAFLKCETKCWLRSSNEPETGNAYAEWFRTKSNSYRIENAKRMLETTPETQRAVSPEMTRLKTASWQFAATILARTNDKAQYQWSAETCLHAVERIPSEGRGKLAQFISIRLIFTNKVGKNERLCNYSPLANLINQGDPGSSRPVRAASSFCGIFSDAGAPPDAQSTHIPTTAVQSARSCKDYHGVLIKSA